MTPVIYVRPSETPNAILLDVVLESGLLRLFTYRDAGATAEDHQIWPVDLPAGTHELAGFPVGAVYGLFGVQVSGSGEIQSGPSNLATVRLLQRETYAVQLTRAPLVDYNAYDVAAYRIQVNVSGSSEIPAEIFLYQKEPDEDPLQPLKDSFLGVCSVADLEQFPVGAPAGVPPFYRLSWVDVVEDRLQKIDEIWKSLASAVRELCIRLGEMEVIESVSVVPIYSGGMTSMSSSSLVPYENSLSSISSMSLSSSSA